MCVRVCTHMQIWVLVPLNLVRELTGYRIEVSDMPNSHLVAPQLVGYPTRIRTAPRSNHQITSRIHLAAYKTRWMSTINQPELCPNKAEIKGGRKQQSCMISQVIPPSWFDNPLRTKSRLPDAKGTKYLRPIRRQNPPGVPLVKRSDERGSKLKSNYAHTTSKRP
jgi:hypothetical protein